MSRRYAAALGGIVRTLSAPLGLRQRERTLARLMADFERQGMAGIDTTRGALKLYTLRSAHCASAARRFFDDEPETLAWIDTFAPGSCFLDVGANIGIYTLYAALDPGLKVIAVEPNGINFGLLIEHLAANGLDTNVTALCVALGARSGLAPLNMRQLVAGAGGAALGDLPLHDDGFTFSQAVPCYTVGELVTRFELPPPRYIKIDVDGTEQDIIAGAETVLHACESILMEVEHRSAEDIESTLEGPLREHGFEEIEDARRRGSGRNRLYRNTRFSA